MKQATPKMQRAVTCANVLPKIIMQCLNNKFNAMDKILTVQPQYSASTTYCQSFLKDKRVIGFLDMKRLGGGMKVLINDSEFLE